VAPRLLRIQHRGSLGERAGREVMVGDDDVDAALERAPHRLDAGDPAIDGDHKLYGALRKDAIEDLALQSVAVDEAMRHDVRSVRAEGAQNGLQENDRR